MKVRWAILIAATIAAVFAPLERSKSARRVGSKKFTESVILGEVMVGLGRDAGVDVQHAQELGGTRILFQALQAGEIDAYPEYTGTISQELLGGGEMSGASLDTMRKALRPKGVRISDPIGFNNGYAIGMLETRAASLGIETLSDLAAHPDLSLGFTSEFMDREDGWPALAEAYGYAHRSVAGMDHDIAYRQLRAGAIDAVDAYTTDADIEYYGLRLLRDDRAHFPLYEAVVLFSDEAVDEAAPLVQAIRRLEGTLDERRMMSMNASARLENKPEAQVAAEFLDEAFGIEQTIELESRAGRLWRHTCEHLILFRLSFFLAALVGLPLGVLSARNRRLGAVSLGVVGIIQTVPALALLVVLIRPVAALGLTSIGSGSAAAIAALFLYSLLPIVRNTCDGLRSIDARLLGSADALGLSRWAQLIRIELPLASRTILAGLKTAAVMNVGFATLGALIGAGGYGQPILTGIRLDDYGRILEGAVPAALLALTIQALFAGLDRWLIPKGLRLSS